MANIRNTETRMKSIMTEKSFFKSAFIALLLISLIISLNVVSKAANAQGDSLSVKSKLEALSNDVASGKKLVTFQFITKIADDRTLWTIGDPKDESRLQISEIGNDYFCLTETSQAATLTRCIPFANIASISYLET
jgi:hypothetical protein